MKKLVLLLLSLVLFSIQAQAINWVSVTSIAGRTGYVDIDSINEYNGYYFFNIKFANMNEKDIVIVTMQTSISNSFGARIKAYKPHEYDALNGDYANITSNMTGYLEPMTYDSLAYACQKKVKEIKNTKNAPKLTF